MRTLFLLLIIGEMTLAATVDGTLITQIKGIPDNATIRSSSNPAILQRSLPNGSYSVQVASPVNDYIIISPAEGDANLYAPRIIRAANAGTDTLYIIPPMNERISIFVDNKTGRDFAFIVDKAVVSDKLVTSEKDYRLEITPQRVGISQLLIAAFASDFPAVVRRVAILPGQGRGYLVIERQDIGLAPLPVAVSPPPSYTRARTEERLSAPHIATERNKPLGRESASPSAGLERAEELYVPLSRAPAVRPLTQERDTNKDRERAIDAAQSAYYFSDRLMVKDKINGSLAIHGSYQTFLHGAEAVEFLHYGLEVYNIRLFGSFYDLSMEAAKSEQLPDAYYSGSLTWHHSPYAAIDLAYKSGLDDAWYSRYDAARMSLGVNGCYKSRGEKFQIGVGVRFQVDYGDFAAHVNETEESQFRYLPGFYLIAGRNFAGTTASVVAGVIDEAFYASASILIARHVGLTYAYKGETLGSAPLTSLEKEPYHKLTLALSLTMKKRP
ncbi:hypothetical protein JXA02_02410 [candidate division KSB1 bacterium]|nr:hypothetical protein [candidate division KSB1 bacterium]RQW10207.1 MAG: hypothetical protein EH222_02635 [candidate division KSB1 bacterium]